MNEDRGSTESFFDFSWFIDTSTLCSMSLNPFIVLQGESVLQIKLFTDQQNAFDDFLTTFAKLLLLQRFAVVATTIVLLQRFRCRCHNVFDFVTTIVILHDVHNVITTSATF